MKLIPTDIPKLRGALMACKIAGLDSCVIFNGKLMGLGPKQNGAIFSTIDWSIDSSIDMGISRIAELEKRLALFGEEVLIEGELSDANKVRKLNIKGKAGKIEFRCTDSKLIKHPKTNQDSVVSVITLTKPEVAFVVKGAKTLGAEQVTFQVKRDGSVHIECSDSNNDKFECDLETAAEFVEDAHPSVNSYASNSDGVFLAMLENMAKESDKVELEVMKTGNIGMTVFGHHAFAIPRILMGS